MKSDTMKRCVYLIFTVGLVTTTKAADTGVYEIATFLYTPTQRTAIIQSRSKPERTSVIETMQHYSGVVIRADGKNALWFNNKVHKPSDATRAVVDGSEVVVKGARLRVGDSVDINSGVRKELLPINTFQKKK